MRTAISVSPVIRRCETRPFHCASSIDLRHRRDPVERQRGIDGHHLLPKQRESRLLDSACCAQESTTSPAWRREAACRPRVRRPRSAAGCLPRRPRSSATATLRLSPVAGARRTRRPIGSRPPRCTSTNRWLTIADSRPGRAIVGREVAAESQRQGKDREVTGVDRDGRDRGRLLGRGWRRALDVESLRNDAAVRY